MASTWSSLKIELLETGQNPGQWGNLTNINLGDAVLGEAITGQATVDFPSDADVTITLTDSATTQAARNLRLNITESSTGVGSVRNLILGSNCQIEKFYLINNTGTGAKTIKNTSGTGITVPAGKATLVFNNGTNVVDAASYFTSLTLGSALPVASGGTGLTAGTSGGVLGYTATGTLASSVALTANALVLGAGAGATPTPMASLGTTTTVLHGNASGAPTFGAVSLTADVTGVLPTANGGTNLGGATPFTSSGVVYASSTSALATGSGLTFNGTSLVAGERILVQNNGTITSGFGDGVAVGGWDSLGFLASNTLVLGGYRASQWTGTAFYASATRMMDLTTTGLGIGTSSPAVKLDIRGGGGTGSTLRIGSDTNDSGTIQFFNTTGSTTNASIAGNLEGGNAGGNLTFSTKLLAGSLTERMRLDSAGNLGLGVTPSAWNVGKAVQIGASGDASLWGFLNSAYLSSNAYYNSNWIYYANAAATQYLQQSGQHIWYNAPSGTTGNLISFTQAMTLDASGNLGVGTTSPACTIDSGGAIRAKGASLSASGEGTEIIYTAGTPWIAATNQGLVQAYNRGASTYSPLSLSGSLLAFVTGGTERARIDSSGNFGIGTSSPSSYGGGAKLAVVSGSTTQTWVVGGSSAGAYTFFSNNAQTTTANAFQIGQGFATGSDNVALLYNAANAAMVFGTNNTERARITATGQFFVGTTTSFNSDNNFKQTTESTTHCLGLKSTGGTGFVNQANWNTGTTGDITFSEFGTEASYTVRGSIVYNRTSGLVVYNTTSDYRAKDISGPVTGSGALIDSVPVYMGKIKGATQERPMFIAHEVPAYAHTGEKDAVDKDGNPVYQQMDASALIPVMWAEIQSLRKRLADAGI